jgi:hypothetical protein
LSNAPVCGEDVTNQVIDKMVDWIKENGGIVDPRQVVKKERPDDITSPTHVYATSLIPQGTVLLAVPWGLVLEAKGETSTICQLVKLLRDELKLNKKNKSDDFGPYIAYLETVLADPIMLPTAWSESGKKLLKQVLGKNLLPDVNAIDEDYWMWKKKCLDDKDKVLKMAAQLVIGYHSPNPSEDEKWYQMIPFYDLYSPREYEYNTDFEQDEEDEEILLTAARDIQAGERIHTRFGFGETMGERREFIDSGVIERFHSFEFTDPSAPYQNAKMEVEFYLDRDLDENGEYTYQISWHQDVRPDSRAYEHIEKELHRIKEINTLLSNDALYFLQPVAPHERKALQEYTTYLLDTLSILLDTKYSGRPKTPWTTKDYVVGGVNLGTYNLLGVEEDKEPKNDEKPYELFEDFDISDLIIGNENWKDMIEYRRKLDRPSVRFYVDKVARKRWLPTKGMPQAKQYVTMYAHELTELGNIYDEANALYKLIPDEADYAAKPSHHSEGLSVWLVSHNKESNVTKFSSTARQLKADEENEFDKMKVANSLTQHLHAEAASDESLILRGVKPGIIVEERFVEVDHFDRGPIEFNCFVIWGRIWVILMINIEDDLRYANTWLHRDGTQIHGKEERPAELDYIDLSRVIEIAETLGRNKDMLRVDIFVGLPAGSPALKPGATREERLAAVEYAVNECEIYPTTSFMYWPQLAQDGARLWVAGYKMGNYRTIPNDEIPKEFLEHGALPAV